MLIGGRIAFDHTGQRPNLKTEPECIAGQTISASGSVLTGNTGRMRKSRNIFALMKTADLHDAHGDTVSIAVPPFRDYGAHARVHDTLTAARVHADNVPVHEIPAQSETDRVRVTDDVGSLQGARSGSPLARLTDDNGGQKLRIHYRMRYADEGGRIGRPQARPVSTVNAP